VYDARPTLTYGERFAERQLDVRFQCQSYRSVASRQSINYSARQTDLVKGITNSSSEVTSNLIQLSFGTNPLTDRPEQDDVLKQTTHTLQQLARFRTNTIVSELIHLLDEVSTVLTPPPPHPTAEIWC